MTIPRPFRKTSPARQGPMRSRGIPLHGTREMPVWGRDYGIEAGEYYMEVPYDREAYVRGRILALIEYINRLQAK